MSQTIHVSVPPDDLYEMVSDVTRMGEWSPVCRECWWDEGAGPHVGAWFKDPAGNVIGLHQRAL